jgi:hypothetical protein
MVNGIEAVSQNAPEELNHLAPGLIGDLRIVSRTFVAHEGMLGWIEAHRKLRTRLIERSSYLSSTLFGYVRVKGAENQKQLAANL